MLVKWLVAVVVSVGHRPVFSLPLWQFGSRESHKVRSFFIWSTYTCGFACCGGCTSPACFRCATLSLQYTHILYTYIYIYKYIHSYTYTQEKIDTIIQYMAWQKSGTEVNWEGWFFMVRLKVRELRWSLHLCLGTWQKGLAIGCLV